MLLKQHLLGPSCCKIGVGYNSSIIEYTMPVTVILHHVYFFKVQTSSTLNFLLYAKLLHANFYSCRFSNYIDLHSQKKVASSAHKLLKECVHYGLWLP
jgi:hypothetical protein